MTETIDTAQPEALRLAHALDGAKLIDDSTEWAETLHAAAAELRRLHSALAAAEARNATLMPLAAEISGYALPTSGKPFADEVLVQRSRQMEGPHKWAVRLNGECLNKAGEWEWEPMPSSRDDEFLARCRFDTAAEAIQAARAAASISTKEGDAHAEPR